MGSYTPNASSRDEELKAIMNKYIICEIVSSCPEAADFPGITKAPCATCKAECWISPSSRTRPYFHMLEVVCKGCAPAKMQDGVNVVAMPTESEVKNIDRHMARRN